MKNNLKHLPTNMWLGIKEAPLREWATCDSTILLLLKDWDGAKDEFTYSTKHAASIDENRMHGGKRIVGFMILDTGMALDNISAGRVSLDI